MEHGYTEEQVYTSSEDGVLLAGMITRPAEEAAGSAVFIFIHGYPVSSSLPFTSKIGRALVVGHGHTFLAANTRGHDIGTWLFRKDEQLMLGGAWWEIFDESPRDLAAWVGFAVRRGLQRVVLVGHSFGALKVVYYQAERQDPRVLGVVAAAPGMRPRCWGTARRPTPERTRLAERRVSEGRGLDLLPWDPYGSPLGTASAQTYLSWVRADNLDLFGKHTSDAAIGKIRCPLFACYGTNDEDTGTEADLEMIRRNAKAATRVETRMFEGADHGFIGYHDELAAALAAWADTLL